MIRLLLGLVLAAALGPVLAQDSAAPDATNLYRVELIVFENLDPAAPQAEQWPADPGAPPLAKASDLNDLVAAAAVDAARTAAAAEPSAPAPTPSPPPNPMAAPAPSAAAAAASPTSGTVIRSAPNPPVAIPAAATPAPAPPVPAWRWLTPAQLRLTGAEQKLAASGRYRPLLHIGWIQPLDTSEHGTPVHIYDGMQPEAAGSPAEATAPPAPPGGADAASPAGTPPVTTPHTLDGVFTVWRGRFLHADLDLGYRRTYTPDAAPTITLPPPADAPQAEQAAPAAPQPQPVTLAVRMTQSRRLRDGELHYVDHPLFGALVTVSPVEAESDAKGGE